MTGEGMTQLYLKRAEVVALVGLGYSTIWRLEREGKFPARRKLSAGRVGWVRSEVDRWAKDRDAVPRAA